MDAKILNDMEIKVGLLHGVEENSNLTLNDLQITGVETEVLEA